MFKLILIVERDEAGAVVVDVLGFVVVVVVKFTLAERQSVLVCSIVNGGIEVHGESNGAIDVVRAVAGTEHSETLNSNVSLFVPVLLAATHKTIETFKSNFNLRFWF